MPVAVAEAEVLDEAGDGTGRRVPGPQRPILVLPEAGARLLHLQRALPVQLSPPVTLSSGLKGWQATASAP